MNIIGIIAAVILAATAPITGSAEIKQNEKTAEIYADCGVIMEEPEKTKEGLYEITFTMQNGNQFSFISEDGDWNTGEIVSAIFNDKGTEEVFDDEIISARYSGWIAEEEIQNWIK